MLVAVFVILLLLYLLGYGPLQIIHLDLFILHGHMITLWDVLIFLTLIWLIDLLPSPFRQIAIVLFIIWIIALLGFIAVPALSNLLIISIIVGLLVYLLGKSGK
jgi:hypothetical protein